MNLKEAITDLKTICLSHDQVNMCLSGTLSDISTPKDGRPPMYPYVFWIIESISGTQRESLISLSGIFQTMCDDTEDSILQSQSDMALIAKDIWSYYLLNTTIKKYAMEDYNLVPFVERLEDSVAGVTMTVTLRVNDPASICNFPLKS